jgi:hypothetical protein
MSDNTFLVMEAQWSSSFSCHGPATAFKIFIQNQGSQGEFSRFLSSKSCGTQKSRENCCISSLSPLDFGGFQSGSSHVLPLPVLSEKQLDLYTPKNTYGRYCFLSLANPSFPAKSQERDLFGMQSILYAADGNCIDEYSDHSVRCFSNGTLALYSTSQCQGLSSKLELINIPLQSLDPKAFIGLFNAQAGSIQGKMIDFNGTGTKTVSWTTYQPDYLLVNNLTNPFEIISLLLIILSFLASIAGFFYATLKCWKKPSKLFASLAISQALWTIFLCVRTYYTFTVFKTEASFNMASNFKNVTLGFAMLATSTHSTLYFNSCFKLERMMRSLGYITLYLTHFSIYFPVYLSYLVLPNPPWLTTWLDYTSQHWYFAFNLLPLSVVLYFFMSTTNPSKDPFDPLRNALKVDFVYSLVMSIHIILFACYSSSVHIRTYSNLMENDRTVLVSETN